MKSRDMLLWVTKAVWVHRTRTLLTILGFTVGIAAVALLSSLGEGLRLYIIAEFTQFGSHVIAITPGKTETMGMAGILKTIRPLSLEDAVAVEQLPGVELTVPVVMGNAKVKSADRGRHTDIAGVGPDADKAWRMNVAIGSFLPREDMETARAFVVLGSNLKTELFGHANPLGQYVHIGGSRFRVCGVMESKGQFLGFDFDEVAFIPVARGLQLFNRDSLMELDIFYSPSISLERITKSVKNLLIGRHGREDFTLISQDEMLETLDSILRILKYVGGGLGAISLLVGGVGILTILMITVNERVNEVGLLRALGGTRRQVRNLFLGEAIFLGVSGGIAGIITVALIKIMLTRLAPGLPFHLSPGIVVVALGVSAAVGVIAGVVPAINATRFSPIDALRAE